MSSWDAISDEELKVCVAICGSCIIDQAVRSSRGGGGLGALLAAVEAAYFSSIATSEWGSGKPSRYFFFAALESIDRFMTCMLSWHSSPGMKFAL